MKLFELYQEESNSTVTHDGDDYSVNKLLKLTKDLPITTIDVDTLKWNLESDKNSQGEEMFQSGSDKKRIADADLTAPIMVVKWNKKLVVLDGIHRLSKAVKTKQASIVARMVTDEILDKCLIKA